MRVLLGRVFACVCVCLCVLVCVWEGCCMGGAAACWRVLRGVAVRACVCGMWGRLCGMRVRAAQWRPWRGESACAPCVRRWRAWRMKGRHAWILWRGGCGVPVL